MTTYLRRRGLQTIPTLFGIVTLVFLMLRMLPGDPAVFIAGENAGQEVLVNLRHNLGLDQPMLVQYVTYLGRLAQGNLGQSLTNGKSVVGIVQGALPITLVVGGLALVLSFLVAVPLGAVAAFTASRGHGALDHALMVTALVVDTIPGFWLALLLMLVFTLQLGLLPATGPLDPTNPAAFFARLALPVAVLAVSQIASVARITRTAVLEVLHEDYIRTARALGTPEWSVLFGHALRNAALPVVTIAGLSFGRLLGGTVLTENIFALPGMGTVLVNAIFARDYPVVQGMILLYTLVFVAVNVATDLLYTRADPRVQL
ncbi:MAG: peptide/nickel transport system permease protein [Chloroflexota bacterium]|jgi:peptide/nickel transport system permease protein|nr:peptide/nickel transport system permease protein [Chloroflexota bacterium]